MRSFKVLNLFSIPVFESNIEVKKEWLTYLKNNVEYERMHSENGNISKDRYLLKKIPDLKLQIDEQVNLFLKKFLHLRNHIEFYMTNSWSVEHSPNDYAHGHIHSNSILSGVYYLDVDENSGLIEFQRDHRHMNLFNGNLVFEYDKFNEVNSDYWGIVPKNGMILLFPSHLMHNVKKNLSNQKRYSVAFNYFAKGHFGNEEGELNI